MTAALLLHALGAAAQTGDANLPFSGQLRLQWDARNVNPAGPLAQANALVPGTAALAGDGATLEAELRSSGRGWNASATLQQQARGSRTWLNEAVATHDAGSWQFSAGKKIVAWDVGYAFRPNDVVQQEERRTLISSLAEGRPVLMAEHFDADTAWSWVWVNPTKSHDQRGAGEPALAARVYQRQGAVDWHGFARLGAHTGASVGAAMAWVASDAVELHASARYLNRADGKALDPAATGLVRSDPWQVATLHHATQALLGATWTHESQLSLLAEAWWDGTAQSDAQWDAWHGRNASLAELPARGLPAGAVAGNLAWQGAAFGASSSLRRSNLYLRLSWEKEGWQPALDLLVHPADGGRLLTAALAHKGDRVLWQGGWRVSAGPAQAVLMQLPVRRQGYIVATWSW
jgi:hypothetical protein